MDRCFICFEDFLVKFIESNYRIWEDIDLYTLQETNDFATRFNRDFEKTLIAQTLLMPDAREVLDYLLPKYNLYIISNGETAAQMAKLRNSNLLPYFKRVFISGQIGVKKPERKFFEYAVKSVNARKKECLVIGDHLTNDMGGAQNFDLSHIFYNPSKTPHSEMVDYEISSLSELKNIL
jgi:putative hydrolase of the HAD superfamily